MDQNAIDIMREVYCYATSDTIIKDYRFRTEIKLRPVDFRRSPIMSLIKMKRRLLQTKQTLKSKQKIIYPKSDRMLVPSELSKIKPNSHPLIIKKNGTVDSRRLDKE
jgi:hypothetical protein